MKALDSPFTKIINGSTQFVIPVFQRDYTWSAEIQCAQLWRDVMHAAHTTGTHGHFLGSVVYIATDDSLAGFTRWMLIDGQQRVTTLTLLLVALRDHITETKWVGGENDPTAKKIDAYYLKNVQEEGEREQKLILRRHDQATLRAIVDKKELPKKASDHIIENYTFFREQIADVDPADVYRGIERLVIVDVKLDRHTDDPQLIFESLNSTGVDLSQSDLIRNYILMGFPEKEQTYLYQTYWSKIEGVFQGFEKKFDAFARDYVAYKTQAAKQEKAADVYYAFRNFFKTLIAQSGSVREPLEDMMRHARHYAAFSIGREITGERGRLLAEIRRHVDVPAMMVMHLLDLRDHLNALSEDELLEALRLIESYTVRRAVCGLQTRSYWTIFANITYGIGVKTPLTDLKVGLAIQNENYRFPTNAEFERDLKAVDLYGLRICRHVLEGLENHATKEPTDTTTYSIEHIMPQNERLRSGWKKMLGDEWKNIQKTWVHRLGNLTLTGYNSTYSDREFKDKKKIEGGFEDSSVRLNKMVREQEVWTDVEISKRTNSLASLSLKIWPALEVDTALVAAARKREMKKRAEQQDIGKIKMTDEARTIFEALRARIRGIDGEIMEMAETKSISYHGHDFFLEVLPRARKVTLLLAMNFDEVDDPSGIAQDATEKKFIVHARYEGGVSINVSSVDMIDSVMPLIRHAYAASNE